MLDEERELNMDFSHLTIADVEALVRRKAERVEVQNKWVCLFFEFSVVKFRNWK